MVEFNKILTGTLFTVIIVLGVVLFYTDGLLVYSPTGGDNVSVINTTMNQEFVSLSKITDDTKSKLDNLSSPDSSFFDKVNAYFGLGLDALRITTGSFDVLDNMIGASADQLGFGGGFIRTVRVMLPVYIIIIIFIGVFLSAVIKWQV